MKKIILSIVFTTMTLSSVNAETLQIVAVVNNDIITSYDFYNRVNMALVNTGLKKNQENFQKVAPIIIQGLIEETLKVQASRSIGLNMSDKEIDQAILTIAERNEMDIDTFNENLKTTGVSVDTLKDQIKANVLWRKYIQKRIAPTVEISDEEVAEFIQKLADNEGEQEYLIEEIFYPIDDIKLEASARDILDELLVEINKDTDSFTGYARKFSKSPNGGQIGWVLPDVLSDETREEVISMEKGEVSKLMRTLQGFSIIKVSDKRIVDNQVHKINEEAVDYKLAMEKIDILQKRKLRDLKDAAFIEVKMR